MNEGAGMGDSEEARGCRWIYNRGRDGVTVKFVYREKE